MTKFSIIIPAYNLAEFLADCLLSIQQQSFPNFEVLIVDDGSEDGTGHVAKEFAKHDSRFRVLSKENGGVSSARNFGLEHAKCEFVWFIDGDDYIHPESLAYLYHLFNEYPEADYATFDYDWTKKRYDGRSLPLESLCQIKPEYFDCTIQEGFENALRFSPIAVCCVCYRRRLTKGYRFRDLCTSEDRLYALEMCFSARGVVHTRVKIYSYFQRIGSASRQYTRKFMEDLFKFSDILVEFRLKKLGWGANYLHFFYCVELLPGIMHYLLRLPRRDDRKWAFDRLLAIMAKVQATFPAMAYAGIDKIVAEKSFMLAWCLLYARYLPRHFFARHPILMRTYQYVAVFFRK